MAKVRYSKLASSDLYENSEFIARDKPEAAYRWVAKVEAACQTLAQNPEMGQTGHLRTTGRVEVSVAGTT